MKPLAIESMAASLPDDVWTTRAIVRATAAGIDAAIEDLTGIFSRRRARVDTTALDLAFDASSSAWSGGLLDAVVVASVSRLEAGPALRLRYAPSHASLLARRLRVAPALCLDVQNACSGMASALEVVAALADVGLARRALVAAGEKLTPVVETAIRQIESYDDPLLASLTLGDAGVALVVKGEAGPGDTLLERLEMRTLPAHTHLGDAIPSLTGGPMMRTEMAKAATVALAQGDAFLLRWLEKNDLGLDAFSSLIAHQASRTNLHGVRRRLRDLGVTRANMVVDNLAHRGNTASTTVFLAVCDALDDGRLAAGDRALLAFAGSGVSVGAATLKLGAHSPLRSGRTGRTGRAVEDLGPSASSTRTCLLRNIDISGACIDASEGTTSGAPTQTVALAASALTLTLERAAIALDDVDAIISVGVLRDDHSAEPALATRIAYAAGRRDDTVVDPRALIAFDIVAGLGGGCLGGIVAALALVASGQRRHCVVVTTDGTVPVGGSSTTVERGVSAAAIVVSRGSGSVAVDLSPTDSVRPSLILVQDGGLRLELDGPMEQTVPLFRALLNDNEIEENADGFRVSLRVSPKGK